MAGEFPLLKGRLELFVVNVPFLKRADFLHFLLDAGLQTFDAIGAAFVDFYHGGLSGVVSSHLGVFLEFAGEVAAAALDDGGLDRSGGTYLIQIHRDLYKQPSK
jgi:hypothetical protein